MKSVVKVFIALFLFSGSVIAFAADSEEIAARVQKLDTNKDGGVSMEEAIAGDATRIKKNFEKLDANKDGKVTAAEIDEANK
ncbi:MAG: hypothetical protein Q8Q50_04705 [Methylobacter sp.]|jgi:Ca2+-binding EF-hand superfamily protein|nr:hypothetical protein [Methylobacter sp.]